jgi:putative transposase
VYYQGTSTSEQELTCKAIIDRLHTDNPTWGARQMSSQLKMRGYPIGRKKARRYMNEMAIDPIYPKPNLSKRLKQAQIVPYLLRNAVITASNQAWSIDITYIPTKHGFLYLTAIIDWYSRCIVGWELDDTLDTRACIEACKKAFKVAKPVILNSDQGCQFTSTEYKAFLKENGIRQSMDGKSRWADNILIERWFRSFKYEEAYLTEWNNIKGIICYGAT